VHGGVTTITEAARTDVRVASQDARRLFHDLLEVGPEIRRMVYRGATLPEVTQLLHISKLEMGTPYGLWRDDCVGFVEDVLGETLWSKSREIMEAIPQHNRVAVPSCFGSSKTWGAGRAALWFAMVYAPGTARVVTIAPIWRQVYRQMWPEIRNAHVRAGLPGTVDQAQLKLQTAKGLEWVAAYGVSAPPHNEAAVQGIHAPNLLLVVDEGGGIGRVIGRNLRALMTGTNSRMVVIGNPPTDDEGSWFESLCGSDDVKTIQISAFDTPNLSGEDAPVCRSCPEEVPRHTMADHLVDRAWVEEAIEENGEDSPYVQAKVYARFPKGGSNRVIPSSWIEQAMQVEEPEDDERFVALSDLDLEDERDDWLVALQSWVRLGVDVASDGGDELVISRCVGDLATIEHTSSGFVNADAMDVAGTVLVHIQKAMRLRDALRSPHKIHVKIDVIGLGWGVSSILKAWKAEGLHDAEIIDVDVRESVDPDRRDDGATFRPDRKRDELWLAGRDGLKPGKDGTPSRFRLRIDRKTQAQLSGPMLGTTALGMTKVESKDSMRGRGLSSPDRAESLLLSFYEPGKPRTRKKKAKLVV
jgi:hypothetical protein